MAATEPDPGAARSASPRRRPEKKVANDSDRSDTSSRPKPYDRRPMTTARRDPRPVEASAKVAQAGSTTDPKRPPPEKLDEHRIAQRQKQIDFGKNTIAYDRYLQEVPRSLLCLAKRQKGLLAGDDVHVVHSNQRIRGNHPITPDTRAPVSKRTFDGLVRAWRRMLHNYDPSKDEGELDLLEGLDDTAGNLVIDEAELEALLKDADA